MLSTKMTEAFSLLMKCYRLIRGLSSGCSRHLTLEGFLSKDSGSELLYRTPEAKLYPKILVCTHHLLPRTPTHHVDF